MRGVDAGTGAGVSLWDARQSGPRERPVWDLLTVTRVMRTALGEGSVSPWQPRGDSQTQHFHVNHNL